jgi:drug/metabolite transporter (DMT)-like permease
MAFGFVLAFIAASCSATAAIVQSIGARRVAATAHLDPRLLLRLVRNGLYATGLALDGASSLLTFTALRTTPLFAVQAVQATNLGMVALIALIVLRIRLGVRDWVAIGGVMIGLVLLVISTASGPPAEVTGSIGWWLLAAVLALAVGAYLGSPRMCGPALPGLLAGLSFGSAALGARLIGGAGTVGELLASPATYAVVLAGLTGLLLYATALQRGTVTVASASTILGQTVAPAAAGWLLLGDRVRPGSVPVAAVGFALAVAGAVALARHAEPHPQQREEATDSAC